MDVFEPGPGSTFTQLHDLNPSLFPPTGLFWTAAIPESGVEVQLGTTAIAVDGSAATFRFSITATSSTRMFGGGPCTHAGRRCRSRLIWSGVIDRVTIRNTDPVYGGFGGSFIHNGRADGVDRDEWATTTFVSAPLAESSSAFALLGQERNGAFFP